MKRLKTLGGLHRYRLDRHISSLLMAIAIGILSGYGAVLFRFVIQGAQYAFYQNTEDILTFANTLPVYSVICLPALGGLVVGLLVRFGAREAKGHGVPEVMEAVSLSGGRIRKRVAFVKIIASAVCRLQHLPDIQDLRASTENHGRVRGRGRDCRHIQCPYCRGTFCLRGTLGRFRISCIFTGGSFFGDGHYHLQALLR